MPRCRLPRRARRCVTRPVPLMRFATAMHGLGGRAVGREPHPHLRLQPRAYRARVRVTLAPELAASRPGVVVVTSGRQARVADLNAGGLAVLGRPVTGSTFRVSFRSVTSAKSMTRSDEASRTSRWERARWAWSVLDQGWRWPPMNWWWSSRAAPARRSRSTASQFSCRARPRSGPYVGSNPWFCRRVRLFLRARSPRASSRVPSLAFESTRW